MIRTVLGDIEKRAVGNVLMHEHIQCVSNDMLYAFGDDWIREKDIEDYSVKILGVLREKGIANTFVDGTPSDLGRNVRLLKRISERTGMHIIASAGMYFYPSMVSCMRSAEDLAKWFIRECENGMEGTGIRPGILKCAADALGMTHDTEKRLTALAITQKETGLPLYAHCSHTADLAQKMCGLFENNGADPEKIILGHASRRLDADYLESILCRGYYICIDQSWGTEKEAATVYGLCQRGYEKRLLFSHDRPIYNDFESPDKLGISFPPETHVKRYSYLKNELLPALLDAGCSEAQCQLFLSDNASDVLDI